MLKNLMVIISVLVGVSSANACPELTGDYQCTALDGFFKIDIPVTQSTDHKGITTYVIDNGPIIADGQFHHADKLPDMMARFVENVNYTAVCEEQSVTFSGDGNVISSGENAKVVGTLTKKTEQEVTLLVSYTNTDGTNELTAQCLKK